MKKKIRSLKITSFKGITELKIADLGDLNVFIGKNNSGKSTILHAIDVAGLALKYSDFSRFQLKLAIEDLFNEIGKFSIDLELDDGSTLKITSQENRNPTIEPAPNDDQKLGTLLVWPDVNSLINNRRHRTPKWVIDQLEARTFQNVNGLQLLHAIKYYGARNERGLTPKTYDDLVAEVQAFFPDISELLSARTEDDVDTLYYEEYGKKLDIIYSGSGLRHFIDIIVKLKLSNSDILLLDEPEMGLHPDMQRLFVSYLNKIAEKEGVQIFLSTHSPIFLNSLDPLNCYRIKNTKGKREIARIPGDAFHTVLGDLGLRPSDVFNQDICVMVEGSDDVIFFEHILNSLYAEEFAPLSVAVLQYGGAAAEGIIGGTIDVSNIVPAQRHVYWIRDRDAAATELPSAEATKFTNALTSSGMKAKILDRREVEFYLPESVLKAAQQGDDTKTAAAVAVLKGDQTVKFRTAAKGSFTSPRGKYLRSLLTNHLTSKNQLPDELKAIVENEILPWKAEVLG